MKKTLIIFATVLCIFLSGCSVGTSKVSRKKTETEPDPTPTEESVASATPEAQNGEKTEAIEVIYKNIKVYKDNVLCEIKDNNGNVIEPFIYEGVAYLPINTTAMLADMNVTWDGKTQSVYLWDKMVPEGTSFIDVCPPYSCDGKIYSRIKGEVFSMSGEEYSDGITFGYDKQTALFNLDSKYSAVEFTVGHTNGEKKEKSIDVFVDGNLVKQIVLEPECMPKKVSIPVEYGLQLKILVNGERYIDIGIGNMAVK